MIVDIIIGIMVLISMIIGFRNGLASTMAHTLGWIAAIICGIVFDKDAQRILNENTGLHEYLTKTLTQKANEAADDPAVTGEGIPDALMELKNGFIHSVAETAGTSAADAAFTVISFLLVVICVRLVTFIFCRLFSKKHNDGVIGFFDGVLGLGIGLVRGVLLALLFLGLICPVLTVASPGLAELIMSGMDDSYVSEFLYNKNILLELINVFKA